MINQRFGRLVVSMLAGVTARRARRWRCVCDCGRSTVALQGNLRSGATKSCGCLRSELTAERSTKHGHSPGHSSPTREYQSWSAMHARCNPDQLKHRRSYRDYVLRGIKVCRRWSSFENFLTDMGSRPIDKTLDRIDNDGNYTPRNCKWSTRSEQNKNRRPLPPRVRDEAGRFTGEG